jgi:hypothetical protein
MARLFRTRSKALAPLFSEIVTMRHWFVWTLTVGLSLTAQRGWSATPAELAATVKAVGKNGEGQTAAIAAAKQLSQGDASTLLPILKSFDGASPLATNWLLGALESVADRAVKQGTLPAKEIEAYVVDRTQHATARRVAYEWLLKVDPTAADRLIPGMLQDPSAEFRRDAVARKLAEAEKLLEADQKDAAREAFQAALQGAVDDDQVKAIIKPLKELGVEVDLQSHFGFLTHWKLIGPFDNTDTQGFDVSYPPERELKFDAKYPGKEEEVGWTEFSTTDAYGKVNLAKALAPHKGAITYAATEYVSDRARSVELRLGTPNAWKLWVNGELIFAREEYHRGTQLDQYRVPVQLRAGRNTILLKVCQNEQKEDWAQDWVYQLRVCDAAGAAIPPAKTSSAAASERR